MSNLSNQNKIGFHFFLSNESKPFPKKRSLKKRRERKIDQFFFCVLWLLVVGCCCWFMCADMSSFFFCVWIALMSVVMVVSPVCLTTCRPPHGECQNNHCVCLEDYWAGEDCSIYDRSLKSGETVMDSALYGAWNYYHLHVDEGFDLVWELNVTLPEEGGGLVSMYVQKDDYPSLSSYLLEGDQSCKLYFSKVEAGTYYAGVYASNGQFPIHYALTATENQRLNRCSGNGDFVQNSCSCYPNYEGKECQFYVQELTPQNKLVGEVSRSQWEYFETRVENPGWTVVWNVSENQDPGETSDCDLYVSFNNIPTLWNWDFSNTTFGDESTIQIPNARTDGRYILGVFGFLPCSFVVSVKAFPPDFGCPDRCSLHGDCRHGQCHCHPGFEGDVCEWMDSPLRLGVPQSGYVDENSWNYYHARVITKNPLVVKLTQNGTENQNCDLFVRANDKPSRFQYDYANEGTDSSFSIVIKAPGDYSWYFGVFGSLSCSYSIQIDETLFCACGLNNEHGDCREGYPECFCHDGWSGPSCSFSLVPLENKVMSSSAVKMFEWRYFKVSAIKSSTGKVSVKERNSEGFLWVFVSFTDPPTLADHDLSGKKIQNIHEIAIESALPRTRDIYIGVYGNPFGTHPEMELEFDIVVWTTPF